MPKPKRNDKSISDPAQIKSIARKAFNDLFDYFLPQGKILLKLEFWSKRLFLRFCSGSPRIFTLWHLEDFTGRVISYINRMPVGASCSPRSRQNIRLKKMTKQENQEVFDKIAQKKEEERIKAEQLREELEVAAERAYDDKDFETFFRVQEAFEQARKGWGDDLYSAVAAGLGFDDFGCPDIQNYRRPAVKVLFEICADNEIAAMRYRFWLQDVSARLRITWRTAVEDRRRQQEWQQRQQRQQRQREQEWRQQAHNYAYNFLHRATNTFQEALNFFNLKEGYTQQELKNAYYAQAKVHHPDVGGSEEKMKQVNNFYDRLAVA